MTKRKVTMSTAIMTMSTAIVIMVIMGMVMSL